jgi:CRP-like cAMP-binding protein
MAADLARIALFQGLKAEDLRSLAARAALRSLPAETLLIRQGDAPDALYAILRGKVKVYLVDENGKECVLDMRGPGQYVGEMMLDDAPRAASVKAIEPTEVAVIPRNDFKNLVLQNPQVALQVIRNLIRVARGHNVRTLDDVRTRAELQLYIERLKTTRAEDLPSVKRWTVAKRWALVTLLVFAIGQYYFLDVLLETMSMRSAITAVSNR